MEPMAELLDRQAGVVSRRQLRELGQGDHEIRRRVRRREWAVVHEGVYVDHTGPLTWLQRAWAAVLVAWPAALSHDSALRATDGPGRRARHDDDPIHVAIDRKRTVLAPVGVIPHQVAGFAARVQWNASPPRVRIEHAVLDLAGAAPDEFAVVATLSDAVQSRRTTAVRLLGALAVRRRYQRRAFVGRVLRDIREGTCSVLEQGYLDHVERPHGLPDAARQVRGSGRGPVYRDVLYAAQSFVVELDGRLFHDSAAARDRDLDRDLDAAVDGLDGVRVGWGQVFRRPCRTAERIGTLLQQRGWQGSVASCPDCSPRAA